jgi:membrane protein
VLSLRRLGVLVSRAAKEFSDDNCTQMAAAISYYVLFSLFPLLIFSVGILGVFLRDQALQDDVIKVVLDNIPLSADQGASDVTNAVRDVAGVGSGALGALGLVGMAWSGSNMFGTIRRSINAAYDIDRGRPVVRQKLLDLALVLGFAPFFLLSIGATAVLRIAQAASEDIPVLGDAADSLGLGWTVAFLLVPLIFSFMAFLFLYWVVPAADVHPGDVWLGALVGAILFEISKVLFSIYLSNFGNYDVVFGSLGAVAAFLFWIYIGANILLFGAEVASEYPRVRRGDYDVVSSAPKPRLRQRAWRLLRGLVVDDREKRRGDDGAGP